LARSESSIAVSSISRSMDVPLGRVIMDTSPDEQVFIPVLATWHIHPKN
jgi:hypothetical protein